MGADKGYHNREFVGFNRQQGIAPHVAQVAGRQVAGLDARTTGRSYNTSQRVRKRIEEIFGWAKEIGGLRRTKHRGLGRVGQHATLVVATYNLLRMARLSAGPPVETAAC